MQHKPKVQKASAKERNNERSEHRKCKKKKWEKNEKQKREEAKRIFSRRFNQQAAKIVQTTKVRIKRKIIHLVSIGAKKVMHLSDVGGDQMQNVTSATR